MTLLFNNNDQKIKAAYLEDLQSKLDGLLPAGYNKIRVIEETSWHEIKSDDEETIACVVRFGAANKLTPDRSTTLQPVNITVLSEADGADIARGVFTALYSNYAMTETTLATFPAVINYYSPTTQRTTTINGTERVLLFMSAAIAWSEGELSGYSITFEDGTTKKLTALQLNYTTQPLTSQTFEEPIGATVVTGANNGATITFTAGTDAISAGLIKTALKEDGAITELKAQIKVGDIGTMKKYTITGITATASTTLRTIDLTVNLMPKFGG